MARIFPSDWSAEPANGRAAREIETLARFQKGLPDTLTVFHGVHWSRVDSGLATIGEIDFVVLAPSGRLLLIEQKSGLLEETDEGLVKPQLGSARPVRFAVDATIANLERRLAPVLRGDALPLDYLLYCPDYAVRSPGSAGIAPERIIDHRQRTALCARIVQAMGDEPARPELVRRLHRFFENELDLVVDASALIGRAADAVTRLSGGLATWARRLTMTPFRLRIEATAGSGKTQLALALLRDAVQRRSSALFVCFNRPLADHVKRVAPTSCRVVTYHQWCQRRLEAAGRAVDFGQPGAFERLEAAALALPVTDADRADCLIVDEGQDFSAAWRDDLLRSAAPGGKVWWLEDPMQNLYGREPVAPPDWPTLHARDNFRSPRAVVAEMNRLLSLEPPIAGRGPVQGAAVEYLHYDDASGPVAQTKAAVPIALRAGFRRQDIAIITFAGRERSALAGLSALGPSRLRRFTGAYDLFGNPVHSEGELLIETVYRFKGQSAPCVILAEVDFETLDEKARRKLFVGMSRASLQLIVVLSERAARALGR